jgi:putative ABC transport system permease protein
MDLMPMLSTLRRHKTASLLIVFEIALTSAIVCNALHLIADRVGVITRDHGLPVSEIVVLTARPVAEATNPEATSAQDLQALRALPGVTSVTLVNQVPYGGNNNYSGVSSDPGRKQQILVANLYAGGEQAVQTLGLRLVEGRDFRPEEILSGVALGRETNPVVGQIIVNRQVARKLRPDGGSVLGEPLYIYGPSPTRIVGVVEQLALSSPGKVDDAVAYAVLVPIRPTFRGGAYVVRVADPAQRPAVLKAAVAALQAVDPNRVIPEGKTLEETQATYTAQDRSMAWLLGGVSVAMLVVTAFGIVGLASFWVEQRTRMIGTRRALGATQRQILRYFQTENFLLTSAGIVLGMVGAYAIGLLLMTHYELPPLPWFYLPAGAFVLWALGQLAVLAPARRAAALPPVAALRR